MYPQAQTHGSQAFLMGVQTRVTKFDSSSGNWDLGSPSSHRGFHLSVHRTLWCSDPAVPHTHSSRAGDLTLGLKVLMVTCRVHFPFCFDLLLHIL